MKENYRSVVYLYPQKNLLMEGFLITCQLIVFLKRNMLYLYDQQERNLQLLSVFYLGLLICSPFTLDKKPYTPTNIWV